MEFAEIKTPEAYRQLVEQFSFLADKELQKYEVWASQGNLHEMALGLPKIISIVNVIGYLRGQDGAFSDIRPKTDFQPELYKNEDFFEKRLFALITQVNASKQEAPTYKLAVHTYYLKARSAE